MAKIKKIKKHWKYKGISDPLYIKERKEFFKEGGNGWWRIFKVYERNW
tara:strand:+ start:3994 stop:4137 length:144 start_codon:yes stop_codon:yes gene_type:complete